MRRSSCRRNLSDRDPDAHDVRRPGQPPILVSITIDDRPADEFVLRDDEWRQHELLLPPPGPRRLRRIDVRVDRLRHGLRGVQVGEVRVVQ